MEKNMRWEEKLNLNAFVFSHKSFAFPRETAFACLVVLNLVHENTLLL